MGGFPKEEFQISPISSFSASPKASMGEDEKVDSKRMSAEAFRRNKKKRRGKRGMRKGEGRRNGGLDAVYLTRVLGQVFLKSLFLQ